MTLPRGSFLIADLNAKGELQHREMNSYEQIERLPGAPELLGQVSGCLWQSPGQFDTPLPDEDAALLLRWRATCETAGVATLRLRGELLWLSLLSSGTNPVDDQITLGTFQQHLLKELHDTGFEPAFALLDLRDRPLAATFNFQSPPAAIHRSLAALTARCFAASYFRFQGLA